ncbi:RnfH family protein [Motiliproteus sediminis]|uniref:RnfH family protein n=1 Tax=Motiliproteus sediminis TaxID=1468178 RepID=UPI001AEF8D5B|nr:RnfH family protein [Motiliproteus sediminis]
MIQVEVAYALPHDQKIVKLKVEEGCTVYEAAVRSKLKDHFPEIDLNSAPMGIFGKAVRNPKGELIREGQRVEIYRPLLIDPKAARANRAAKVKAEKKAAD